MRGFTLLEVMIALAIAAGALLTVISSVNYHLSIVANDRQETAAALLGRAKLEDPDFVKQKEDKGDFGADHPGFRWETETLPSDLPMLNRKRLTVLWGEGDQHKISLVEYVPKQ
jgi:general secretion pathway protein I